MGRRHLDLDLLAHWFSKTAGSTDVMDHWVLAKSKFTRMSQSFERHLFKVQLLVISRGSSLALESSTLDLNGATFKTWFCHFLPLGLEQSFKNLSGPRLWDQCWHFIGCYESNWDNEYKGAQCLVSTQEMLSKIICYSPKVTKGLRKDMNNKHIPSNARYIAILLSHLLICASEWEKFTESYQQGCPIVILLLYFCFCFFYIYSTLSS